MKNRSRLTLGIFRSESTTRDVVEIKGQQDDVVTRKAFFDPHNDCTRDFWANPFASEFNEYSRRGSSL